MQTTAAPGRSRSVSARVSGRERRGLGPSAARRIPSGLGVRGWPLGEGLARSGLLGQADTPRGQQESWRWLRAPGASPAPLRKTVAVGGLKRKGEKKKHVPNKPEPSESQTDQVGRRPSYRVRWKKGRAAFAPATAQRGARFLRPQPHGAWRQLRLSRTRATDALVKRLSKGRPSSPPEEHTMPAHPHLLTRVVHQPRLPGDAPSRVRN
ncbi:uncharacterized protein LOC111823568 [Myotis lucifugus]|uniref:uncharacterized protein LOC111823568 n=1 Tax=Myotis lucifugus TaxID=59463 RepID=UPI000CCBEC6E|nr:uncharacterized protein LOC111823568 [Myotis lucifugus]